MMKLLTAAALPLLVAGDLLPSRPDPRVDPYPARPVAAPSIPSDCSGWHDGCNSCGVRNGEIQMCTMMFCQNNGPAFCTSYLDGTTCEDAACGGKKGAAATTGTCGQTTDPSNRFCSRMMCRNSGATNEADCMAGGANSCCAWTGAAGAAVSLDQQPTCDACTKAGGFWQMGCASSCMIADLACYDGDVVDYANHRYGASCPAAGSHAGVSTGMIDPGFGVDPGFGRPVVDPMPATTGGNPACWSGAYDADRCCKGASGDASCWSGRYTFQFCCNGNGH